MALFGGENKIEDYNINTKILKLKEKLLENK